MGVFPIFLRLEGRQVVVAGGGAVAEEKIAGMLRAGARIRLIAPEITPQIAEWVRAGKIAWNEKQFEPDDMDGASLAFAATSAPGVNEAVFQAAESRGILSNAADDTEHCRFYCGAIVQRGDLQIAISTNGRSPALAQRLRKELETQFGAEYGRWLEWLGDARAAVRASGLPPERVKALLHELASRESYERFVRESGREAAGQGAAGQGAD